jgi:DNA-binding MarR family transcriptional regulator
MDLEPALSTRAGDAKRPVTRVFRHLLGVARFFRGVIDEMARKHGLNSGDFLVLMTLARDPKASTRPTELYRSLLVTSGAITKRLQSLERAGLVRRDSPQSDARTAPVRLTVLGQRLAEQIRASPNAMHEVADVLGVAELEKLDDALVAYLGAIEAVAARRDAPATVSSASPRRPRVARRRRN